ncbi:MAG: queuosine precursor transporter [Psychrilyobacter sp.]|nr:queuosine precursor transporter [Psychrilyobacter sp.]
MHNIILWFAMLMVNFGFILFFYKKYGKYGLYAYIPITIILAQIQVNKAIEIGGMSSTLGNIMFASSFLVTDILSEKYGLEAASKGAKIGLMSNIVATILLQISVAFTPSQADYSQVAMETLFGPLSRFTMVGLICYWISQNIDIHVFEKLKQKFPEDKFLWLRNNGSTIFSQFFDTAIFTYLAFYLSFNFMGYSYEGFYDFKTCLEIFTTTYLMKIVIATLDTPFLYLAKKITHQNIEYKKI